MTQSVTKNGGIKYTAESPIDLIALKEVKSGLNRSYTYKNSLWVEKKNVKAAETIMSNLFDNAL